MAGARLHPRDRPSADGRRLGARRRRRRRAFRSSRRARSGSMPRVGLACLPARSVDDAGRVPPRPGHRPMRRRRGLGRLRAAGRVRAECLAAGDAGRGADRRAPPPRRGLDPSRHRRPGPPAARRLLRRPDPAGAGASGASRPSRPGSCSSPTGRATPPPAPTPTA